MEKVKYRTIDEFIRDTKYRFQVSFDCRCSRFFLSSYKKEEPRDIRFYGETIHGCFKKLLEYVNTYGIE